jgi:hypothetical protein
MSLKVATWNRSQYLHSDYCTRCQEQCSLVWSVCHSYGSLSQHIMLILFILAAADSLRVVSPAARPRRLASHDWTLTVHASTSYTQSHAFAIRNPFQSYDFFYFLVYVLLLHSKRDCWMNKRPLLSNKSYNAACRLSRSAVNEMYRVLRTEYLHKLVLLNLNKFIMKQQTETLLGWSGDFGPLRKILLHLLSFKRYSHISSVVLP